MVIVLFLLTILFGVSILIKFIYIYITIFIFYAIYKGGKRFLRFNWYKIIAGICYYYYFYYGTGFTYNNIFKQHHRDRFEILLGLKQDNQGKGYNSHQSELTISSGGLQEKDF